MPLTFIEIEKQKNWRIGIFFLVLLFMYFAITIALVASLSEIFSIQFLTHGFLFNPRHILIVITFSLIIASIHFYFSAFGAVSFVIDNLGAMEPDPEDVIHKRLINIMEEIHVVTGNKRNIDCVVIPTLSMNALSAVDLRGNAIVAITEGLLSRLTRPQLETVMAHEAYHVLSGDCLETTVASSLFGVPASAMEKIQSASRGRTFLSPPFLFAWILLKLSNLLNMFISREREYRADAGAVRMTRNPLALAEVLHLLSRNWRGVGYIGSGLEMLCIVNPTANAMDESEGWIADLMSTYPPIRKRIEILLKMAHVDISELDAKAMIAATPKTSEPVFYALDPKHQWQGPYTFAELSGLPWLSPLTWISVNGQTAIERAWNDPLIDTIFMKRLAEEEKTITDFKCPSCQQPLIKASYEKTQVYQCKFCGGILVENSKIPRIIARAERPCTDRVKALSRVTIKENQIGRILRGIDRKMVPLISCPKCKNKMLRTFYSLAYLVEIDRCGFCGLTWFDQDELEMIQCMIENKMASVSICN
ncbi:MAG: M48 family metalloprotease [Nitrospirae bacterium]|nr:M48 family metalloprotease [Nitrospirota bacterium]